MNNTDALADVTACNAIQKAMQRIVTDVIDNPSISHMSESAIFLYVSEEFGKMRAIYGSLIDPDVFKTEFELATKAVTDAIATVTNATESHIFDGPRIVNIYNIALLNLKGSL